MLRPEHVSTVILIVTASLTGCASPLKCVSSECMSDEKSPATPRRSLIGIPTWVCRIRSAFRRGTAWFICPARSAPANKVGRRRRSLPHCLA
jgi:hypothetical protein